MPFRPDDPKYNRVILREGFDLNPDIHVETPSAIETVGAALRKENPIVSAFNAFGNIKSTDSDNFDPDFRVVESIQGTEYEGQQSSFSDARNEDDVERIKRQLDRERDDDETLAASGAFGVFATLGAALLSPTSALPGGGIVTAAKGGVSIGKSALSVSKSALLAAGIDEAVLQGTQHTRSGQDTALALGGSVILGGFLGAGAAKLSKVEFARSANAVEQVPESIQELDKAFRAYALEADAIEAGNLSDGPRSVGAADANVSLEVLNEKTFQFISKIPILGLITKTTPVTRVMLSANHSARRVLAGLVETPLQWAVNAKGQTVNNGVVPVETRIRTRKHNEIATSFRDTEKLYAEYVNDGPSGNVSNAAAPLVGRYQNFSSNGQKHHRTGFYQEVGKAMRNGDIHDIPQVQKAAQVIRKNVFDKSYKEMVELGIIDTDLNLKNGQSYLTRSYNNDKIKKNWDNGGENDLKVVLTEQFKNSRLEAQNRLASDDTVLNIQNDLATQREAGRQARKSYKTAENKAKAKRDTAKSSIKREEAKLRVTDKLRNQFDKRKADLIQKTTDGYKSVDDLTWRKAALVGADGRSKQAGDLFDDIIKREAKALKDPDNIDQSEINQISSDKAELQQQLLDQGHAVDLNDGTPDLSFAQEISVQIKTAKQVLKNAPPDMLRAMVDLGGVKSGSDAGELKSIFDTSSMRYSRSSGFDPDDMRGMLSDLGYLEPNSTVADFWNAVRANKEGDKIYSFQEHGADIEAYEAAKAFSDTLDELGLDINDATAKDIIGTQTKIAQNENTAKAKSKEAGRSANIAKKSSARSDDNITKAFDRLETANERLADLHSNVAPRVRDEILTSRKNVKSLLPKLKKAKKAQSRDEFYANYDDADIDTAVQDVFTTLQGLKPGQHSYGASLSSPSRARTLDIEDKYLEPWLENDAGLIMSNYFDSVVPDIEITRTFGDLELTDAMSKINDEMHRQLRSATTEKQRIKITNEAEASTKDLQAMSQRIRGVYGVPDNPDDIFVKAGRISRSVSYMGYLGGMTISAIPDVASVIGRGGVEAAFGTIDAITDPKRFAMSVKEAQELGASAEWYLNSRAASISDVADQYGQTSKFERGLATATNTFSHATGMVAWNTGWKSVGGALIVSKASKAAFAVKTGKATTKDLTALAENGIDTAMAQRIATQLEKHGDMNGNLWLAQAGKWDDPAARDAMQHMVTREIDLAIITPGQDKPLIMSREGGKFFLQFKSFIASANDRILLSGIQRRDASVLAQVTVAIALGRLVGNLKADAAGYERKTGAAAWEDAIDRSGLAGWLLEAHSIGNSLAGGNLSISGEQVSRFNNRSKIGSLTGPNVGLLSDFGEGLSAAASGKATSRDVHKLAKPIPGNNLFYVTGLFKKVEDRMGEVLGAKPRDE